MPIKFTTTDDDIIFVDNFYINLKKCFENIIANDGLISCFSFAVFDQGSIHSSIKKFAMFKEFLELQLKIPKLFLAEWQYSPTNYMMQIIKPFSFNKKKEYVTYNDFYNKTQNVLVIIDNQLTLINYADYFLN